ncbi:MAG: hypothetical protein ACLGJB_03780 [Blastocatellia bacterium]
MRTREQMLQEVENLIAISEQSRLGRMKQIRVTLGFLLDIRELLIEKQ